MTMRRICQWKIYNARSRSAKTSVCRRSPTIKTMFSEINNPDVEHRGTVLNVSHCVFYKVVAVGFNTLCYDASVGVLNPRTNKISHRRKQSLKIFIMRLLCMVIREFSWEGKTLPLMMQYKMKKIWVGDCKEVIIPHLLNNHIAL